MSSALDAQAALRSAARSDWMTPQWLIEAARDVLGMIDLDPASCALANERVRATHYYSPERGEDGLALPWDGYVFVNPPGRSKSNPGGQAAWWAKATREWRETYCPIIFIGFSLELLQTAQCRTWQHPLDFSVCIPKRRIRFEHPDTASVRPTHGNIIVCLSQGGVMRRFKNRFSEFGYVR
jgi:ParB family transcriptional regulator, chromosome partitioning protein